MTDSGLFPSTAEVDPMEAVEASVENKYAMLEAPDAATPDDYKNVLIDFAQEQNKNPDLDALGVPIIRMRPHRIPFLGKVSQYDALKWVAKKRPDEEGGGYVHRRFKIGLRADKKATEWKTAYDEITQYDNDKTKDLITSKPIEQKGKQIGRKATGHTGFVQLSRRDVREHFLDESGFYRNRKIRKLKRTALAACVAVTGLRVLGMDAIEPMPIIGGSEKASTDFTVKQTLGEIVLDGSKTVRVTLGPEDAGNELLALDRTVGDAGCADFATLATDPSRAEDARRFTQRRSEEYGPVAQDGTFFSPYACPEQ